MAVPGNKSESEYEYYEEEVEEEIEDVEGLEEEVMSHNLLIKQESISLQKEVK